jgi:aldose 1-epimerase
MYTIINKRRMSVTLCRYGGIIQSILVPDRNGALGEVVLGLDSEEDYLCDSAYLGATIGRYANRIGGAAFKLDGNTYLLTKNEGDNCLHGGNGFHKRYWDMRETENGAVLSIESPDGDEGFPGNLKVSLEVTLTDENKLVLDYAAEADADTVLSLTNHSYFNLACQGDVLSHELRLDADAYLPTDSKLIPTGEIRPVEGTKYDFRKRRPIGEGFYDTCFILNPGGGVKAEVYEPSSGRGLRVYTDMPALQLYCSAWLGGAKGRGGRTYKPYEGLCLETQLYPDAPNKPNFPTAVLKAGEAYRHRTVYQFFAE